MPARLNQIFRETIELIKDSLDVTLRLRREWIRGLVAAIATRRAVTNLMATHNLPGASIAIAYRGRLVFRRAYGLADTATNEAVTTNHVFRIASLSKPITAVAVFRLIEAGHLQLSDRIFGSNGVLGTTYGTQPY